MARGQRTEEDREWTGIGKTLAVWVGTAFVLAALAIGCIYVAVRGLVEAQVR